MNKAAGCQIQFKRENWKKKNLEFRHISLLSIGFLYLYQLTVSVPRNTLDGNDFNTANTIP